MLKRRTASGPKPRRLSGLERLEPRIVLTASGFPGNDCPPDLNLAAVAPQQIAVGQAFTLDLLANGATVVDMNAAGQPTGDQIRFLLDPDVPSDTPVEAAITSQGVFSWTPTADQVGTHVITVIVVDHGTPALADAETFSVTVLAANQAPVVDLNGPDGGIDFTAIFTEDAGSTSIVASAGLTVSDANDANLRSATITLAGAQSSEVFSVATSGTSITANYDSSEGILSLFGTDTVANYQKVLRTLKYDNTSHNPGTVPRLVSVVVNDGVLDSATAVTTVNLVPVNDAPVVSVEANESDFVEDAGPITLPIVEVSDVDSPLLAFVTVTIVDRPDGMEERLLFSSGTSGVIGSYDSAAGVLTLSGSATPEVYTQVLATVKYNNASQSPSGTLRTLTIVANDGSESGQGQVGLRIVALNDAPNLHTVEDQTITLGETMAVTLTANDPDIGDTLIFELDEDNSPAGASLEQLTNTTAVIRFTATSAAGPGPFTFRVLVNDSGTPALSDSETFEVTFALPNRAPDLADIPNQSVSLGSELQIAVTATDPDSGELHTFVLDDDNLPASASLEQLTNTTAVIRFMPTAADGPGPFSFRVLVIDSGTPALSDAELFEVTVTEASPLTDQLIRMDSGPHDVDLSDVFGSENDWSIDAIVVPTGGGETPATLALSGRTLTLLAAAGFLGSFDIKVVGTDGLRTIEDVFAVRVLASITVPRNQGPIDLAFPNGFPTTSDFALSAQITPMGSTIPATIHVNGPVITIEPQSTFVGEFELVFSAEDPQTHYRDSVIVEITNTAPQISSISPQTVTHGRGPLDIAIAASDPEQDSLMFTARLTAPQVGSEAPAILAMSDNVLTVSSRADYVGTFTVTIDVTDGLLADSITFSIQVHPSNVTNEAADLRIPSDFPMNLPDLPEGLGLFGAPWVTPKYETYRQRFLEQFFFNGMTAQQYHDSGQTIEFSDQSLDMGFALLTFAGEAKAMRAAGASSSESEAIVRQLLVAFEKMDKEGEIAFYGTNTPGFFVRDVIVNAGKNKNLSEYFTGTKANPVTQLNAFTVESDLSSVTLAEHHNPAMSLDQVVMMYAGWWAVANWSRDATNMAMAKQQIGRVQEYLIKNHYYIELPDGGEIPYGRGPDFRGAAGFLSEIAGQVTGKNYVARHDNFIRIHEITARNVIRALQSGPSVLVESVKGWLGKVLDQSIPIDIPVAISHQLALEAYKFNQGGHLSFNMSLNDYLPNRIVNKSFSYPTLVKTTWWTSTPWGRVSMTGLKTVIVTTKVGDILDTLDFELSLDLDPTDTGPSANSAASWIALVLGSFESDIRVGSVFKGIAQQSKNPWAIALRANVQGIGLTPADQLSLTELESTAPRNGPTGNGTEWAQTNRWIHAIDDPHRAGQQFNGLDFLSMKVLMANAGVSSQPEAGTDWVLARLLEDGSRKPRWSPELGGFAGGQPIVGDWDGNGTTDIGVYIPTPTDGIHWVLAPLNSDGVRLPPLYPNFGGGPDEQPIVGDWDGDGITDIGLYNPNAKAPGGDGHFWTLARLTPGGARKPLWSPDFGGGQDEQPVVGDWDGNGTTDIGVYTERPADGNYWVLARLTEDGSRKPRWYPDFGGGVDEQPVVGDWDGNGTTDIGIYNPRPTDGNYWVLARLTEEGSRKPRWYPDFGGGSSYKPIVGDWDGNGTTDIGVYIPQPADGNEWVLARLSSDGSRKPRFFPNFGGGAGEQPVIGDWNGDGLFDIGVYRGEAGTGLAASHATAESMGGVIQLSGNSIPPATVATIAALFEERHYASSFATDSELNGEPLTPGVSNMPSALLFAVSAFDEPESRISLLDNQDSVDRDDDSVDEAFAALFEDVLAVF